MLLAHGGGVPEALTVGVPLLAVVAFVLLERRARDRARARAREQEQHEAPEAPEP